MWLLLAAWTAVVSCCLQSPCNAQTMMTASSDADLAMGFGNPNISVIIMLTDIVLDANFTVIGAAADGLYELTRNVTVTVAEGKRAATDWYPTLDVTYVMTPRVYLPLGIALTYDHVMFARLGPFLSLTVGPNGFGMPYVHYNSPGTLQLFNGGALLPYCNQTEKSLKLWRTIPRSVLIPGTQLAEAMPDGWCAIPRPDTTYTGQCFSHAYRLVDVAWAVDTFKSNTSSTSTSFPWRMQEYTVNMVVMCNQVLSSAPPPPQAGGSAPLNTGVVVGAALGAAAFVVLLAAALALLWRRRRMQLADVKAGAKVPAGRYDEDVVAEAGRSTSSMREQLTMQAQSGAGYADSAACSSSSPQVPSGSGTPLLHGDLVPEAAATCNGGLSASASSPDLVDELHEMSRSMQTSIRDKQLHIQAVIGSGAFGTVYRGTWQGLPVAIKTLMFSSHTLGGNASRSHSVLTEAALSKSITHPNVVATYNCELQRVPADRSCGHSLSINDSSDVVSDWRIFIIQEFCDGGSLYDALWNTGDAGAVTRRRGKGAQVTFDLATVFQLAFDIACGMSHLHERNVIHGDLNPANVLLKRQDSGWTPKVCDFGFSVHLPANQSHVSNTRRGTPFYIAPEVLQCGKMSRAADVYAMGVMLWELYMGRTVWQVSATGTIELQPTFPRLPSDTPLCYSALVADCTCADATQRPSFLGVLDRLLELKDSVAAQQVSRGAVGASMGPALRPPPALTPNYAPANAPPTCTRASQGGTPVDAHMSASTISSGSGGGMYSYSYCSSGPAGGSSASAFAQSARTGGAALPVDLLNAVTATNGGGSVPPATGVGGAVVAAAAAGSNAPKQAGSVLASTLAAVRPPPCATTGSSGSSCVPNIELVVSGASFDTSNHHTGLSRLFDQDYAGTL